MRLAFILATLISTFLAATLIFFIATRRTYPGFKQWTAGTALFSLGYFFLSIRGAIFEPVSIFLGNVAFPLGMVLQLNGIVRFLDAGRMSRVWYTLPIVNATLTIFFYFFHDSASLRHFVTAISIAIPHWAIAATILRHPKKYSSIFYPVIGSMVALAGVVVLLRPLGTLLFPEWHLLLDSPFQIGSLTALIIFQLGENLSMIMLNSERVENELAQAQADLLTSIDRLQEALDEQKLTQESLRQSEERYRTFFNTSRDCVFMTTTEGRFIDVNDAGLEMLGYAPEYKSEMLRKSVADLYADPHERQTHSLTVQRLGFCQDYPVDFRKRDGTIMRTLVTTVAKKNPEGIIIGFQGIVRDITEQQRAQEALRISEEKHKLIVEKAQEGICIIQDTIFRFVNPKLSEISGYSAHELIGRSFTDMVHPEDRERVKENHFRRLQGEAFASRYELRFIDKFGAVKWVEVDSATISWEGQPAVMVLLVETTYRKLAEDAAVQAERLRAIADLSSGVAHHFNNLLQMIIGTTSLSISDLECGEIDQIKPTLEKMLEAAVRGSEMVKHLQAFADVEVKAAKRQSVIFDVADAVNNAVEISKPFWKSEQEKHGKTINLRKRIEKGCSVKGEVNDISEVLVHLLRNAAEAMPEGGDIDIAVLREDGFVSISIRDTGVGIDGNDLPRIFEPFWSSKGVGVGKGMGLAAVHGLTKRHNGTVSVESSPGFGTTMTLRLPWIRGKLDDSDSKVYTEQAHNLRILLIDDESLVLATLEKILQKAGHSVFAVLSGAEGIAVFNQQPIDLIISDLGMPGMSGWDFGKAVKAACSKKGIAKPPVVLLTGWGGQELESEKIMESGVDLIIAKPVNSEMLLSLIRQITESFRMKSGVS